MNARKSSLPVSADEKSFMRKDIASLKHIWHGAKKRLVASCSRINISQESSNLPSIKVHSFPGSTATFESPLCRSINSSNSSISITDTMLKVRRLTHVYDQEELIAQCIQSPLLSAITSQEVTLDNDNEYEETEDIPKPSAKFGDRSYKLPTKAAAILGANDLFIHQILHDGTIKNSSSTFSEYKIKKTPHADSELIDAPFKALKSKKKTGIGSEVKEKIASLWKQSELSPMAGSASSTGGYHNSPIVMYSAGASSGLHLKDMEKLLRCGKASVEQIKNWSHSFECLLHDKFGLAHFHDFLRSEFSDENIEFWIACEEYRTITNNKKLQSRAEKIYNDYVGVQAAREVNLDSKTRQQTEIDIHNPSPHTFDQAQKRIQALMEKDSYQRFLRSELYGRLLRASEEYHLNQLKADRELYTPAKGITIGNLGITAQDLSKLTMTTSKLALMPHTSVQATKAPREMEPPYKAPLKITRPPEREPSLISTVQPGESSLPFSKSSLMFIADDKH